MVARDPAIWSATPNASQWGYFRWGVKTSAFERAISQVDRLFYRRVAQRFVDQDSTTGWHVPAYTEQAIYGVLVERGGSMPSFVSGVTTQRDAVLITISGVREADQIRDPLNSRIYEVQGEPEERVDPDTASFAYRVSQLHYLPFMRS
jgi:hypothetical protein